MTIANYRAELLALFELYVETSLTIIWLAGAVALAWLLLRRLRPSWGTPLRLVRRVTVRVRWASVARSCGLAVVKDHRLLRFPAGGFDVVDLLTAPVDARRPAATATGQRKAPLERLPRIRHGRSSADRLTTTWQLTPPRGLTVEDVADHAQALADGLKVPKVVIRRVGANRGEMTAYFGDVFARPRRWEPTFLEHGIPWGVDEHGHTTVFPLGQGHALVAGATGSGKSGFVNSFVASAAIRPDVALLGVDLKRVELSPWRDRFTDLAVDPTQAARLIAEVADEVRRRYSLLEAAGLRKMTSSGQGIGPWVLVVIDELSELLDSIEKGDLISIGRLARACGISLFVAAQRPTAKTLTADLRDQLDVMRWCGRVPPNSTTGEMCLGDTVKVLDPSTIDRDQKAVGVLDDATGPRFARPDWLDDAHVAQVARATAHLRIPVEHVLVKQAVPA